MRARSVPLSLAILIPALAFAVAGCSSQETASPDETGAATGAAYETVDVQTAYDALSSNADAQIVDVREPVEWAETGVPEAAALHPSRRPGISCRLGARDRPAGLRDLPQRQPQPDRLRHPRGARLHAGVQRGRRHHGVAGRRATRGDVHALTRAPAP